MAAYSLSTGTAAHGMVPIDITFPQAGWAGASSVVPKAILEGILRRVEFGIWLSNTTEKFEISLGFAS